MPQSETMIFGHRGCAAEAPENTLASFALAVEQGCDAIELDIHLSKDGDLIVCHDRTIDRTTDRRGLIHEMTTAELKQADAGRWFDERFAGETIPLLEEVFDLVPPSILMNIEVKYSYGGKIEPVLIDFLSRRNRLSDVLITSFDYKSLCAIKRQAPEIPIGLTYSCDYVRHYEVASLVDIPVNSLHPSYLRVDKQDVTDALDRGFQVFVYTVNTEQDFKRMLDYGVTGVLSDCPGKLRKFLQQQ